MIEPESTNDVSISDKEQLRDTVECFREIVQIVRDKLARGGREIPGYLMLNPDVQRLEIPRLVVHAHLLKRVIQMPRRNSEPQMNAEPSLEADESLKALRGLLRSNDFVHLRRCGIPLSIVAQLRRQRRGQIWRMTRIIRAGWHIEPESSAANCRALDDAIPTHFAFTAGNELASVRAQRFHLLSHLLDGADVIALRHRGALKAARDQRRANARLFLQLVGNLSADIFVSKSLILRHFKSLRKWDRMEVAINCVCRGLWEIFRLRIAAVLYRMKMPISQQIALSGLAGLRSAFEELNSLSAELFLRSEDSRPHSS